MDTLIHADIFFFVSSIGFILITVGILVLIYYAVRAVRRFEEFTKVVEGKLEDAQDELTEFKEGIREGFLYGLIFGKAKRKRKEK